MGRVRIHHPPNEGRVAREGGTEALWRPIAAQVSQRNHSLHRRLEVAAELVPDEGGTQERNQRAISTQSARNQHTISAQSARNHSMAYRTTPSDHISKACECRPRQWGSMYSRVPTSAVWLHENSSAGFVALITAPDATAAPLPAPAAAAPPAPAPPSPPETAPASASTPVASPKSPSF